MTIGSRGDVGVPSRRGRATLLLFLLAVVLASLLSQGGWSPSFAQSPQSPVGGSHPPTAAPAGPTPLVAPSPAIPWLVAGASLAGLVGASLLARWMALPAALPSAERRDDAP